MEISAKDMDEIVAIMVNNEIYGKQSAIRMALQYKDVEAIYSRAVFKMMAMLDFGQKWHEWSEFPTLFTLTALDNFNSM